LVVAVEADAGRRLAEAVVKELTGGDAVTARFLYGEYFTFTPQFKLWLGTNHKPVIRGTDRAIWRRIRLVPFTVTIPPEEQDPELKEKLCGELSGILTWALEGCAAWRWHRLGECQAVHAATESYREESDVLADFLASECVQAPGVAVLSRDLYQRYEAWCEANGERALTQRNLGRALEERGFLPQRRHGGTRWWAGVGLLTAPTGDAGDADEPEPEKSG
jgi:putative DNA primase/helicase